MPDRYLANARQAEKLASGAMSEGERRVHLEVAALWHELARKKAERIRSAEALAGGPVPKSAVSTPISDIQLRIDDERRRLSITISGDVDGQIVADQVCGTFLAQPRVTRMDMVYDLTHLTGGVGAEHMNAIAAAYLAGANDLSLRCRTAIVAPSPFYQRWTEPLSRQFRREHRAFATLADAEPFLAEPLSKRTPMRMQTG